MDADPKSQTGGPREALLNEIFTIYQEAATACQKTVDDRDKRMYLEIKRCAERALISLSPLDEQCAKRLEELRAAFPAIPDVGN
jgi:hypothetical protein